ncbi:MAG: HEAT repeat domain-containing protein [Planctomycetes bacterium]|nr:HEAT repeat domain-containing protein [Planctomycetota bacterium]
MRRAARAPLVLGLVAAALVVVAAPAGAQSGVPAPELARWIEALAAPDPQVRAEALARLGEVATRAPEDLRPFLAHDDPDVRFQVLALLSVRDARTEQHVRQIVEGRSTYSATYPQALEARAALLAAAEAEADDPARAGRTLDLLVRLARRRAGGGEIGARYALVALGVVADILARAPLDGDVAREMSGLLATLTEAELDEVFHELAVCFAALPADAVLGALRAVIGGGSPMAQARAARLLAESTDAARADAAAAAVLPILGHALPEVRLAGLRALSVMPLPPSALLPVAVMTRDPDATVAEEAMRLSGERGLAPARERAEQVVRDPRAPLGLRRQAVRALGLLGHAGSAAALRPLLEDPDRDLRVLAGWALGAVRAPGALEALQGLIAAAELGDDDRFFAGLARLGGPGVAALGAMLEPGSGAGRARRQRAIRALGRAPAGAAAEAVALLAQLSTQPLANRLDEPTITPNELEHVIRALGDLAPACDDARVALARLVERGDLRVLGVALPVIAEVGPPLDPALTASLRGHLARYVSSFGGSLRPAAGAALLRVDRAHALEVLRRAVGSPGRGIHNDDALELMRVLARAGDPGPVQRVALPWARDRLEQERRPEDRLTLQNRLGIELLYAEALEEAILEFRRMLWCRPGDSIASYNVACGHALAGRVDDALRYLRRSVRNGYRDPQHMSADPDLDALRGDERFERLIGRLRLEDETGLRLVNDSWPRRLLPN